MLRAIIALFRRPPPRLLERFFERFVGRTVVVHRGLSAGWVGELQKEAGGQAHFRFDVRRAPGRRPTPIEWVVHREVLPHELPLPLLMRVEPDGIRLRHLVRSGRPVHPSEIRWMLGELVARHHLFLRATRRGLAAEPGMSVEDNKVYFEI
jgi:hypothetical protein